MEKFYSGVQNITERYLTRRKALKATKKARKRTFVSEVLDWLDAIVFAVVFVLILNQFLFQLFIIPSPSMLETLQIGDRVIVSKLTYGIELFPQGPKIFDRARNVDRDDIITFYNPDYESRGPVFDILSNMIYMATFSLVNIDKDENGQMRERLLVKRAGAVAGDTVTFRDGDAYIRVSGTSDYVREDVFRAENGLSTAPHRTIEKSTYAGYKAIGIMNALYENGVFTSLVPKHLVVDYSALDENAFYSDNYEYYKSYARGQWMFDPTDFEARSTWTRYDTGSYVPSGYVLPLGDNRDNSLDGRYFGPVPSDTINGYVFSFIYPLSKTFTAAR